MSGRRSLLVGLASLLLGVTIVSAGAREVTLFAVDPLKGIPPEMARPEGRTRWDLTGVALGRSWTRRLEDSGKVVSLRDLPGGAAAVAVSNVVADPAGGDAALRWAFPDRYPDVLRPGARQSLRLEERKSALADLLSISVETVGVGWVHLPSGPREVALQRALVTRDDSATGLRSTALVHRWVDPRAGVVAEIVGPASPDGTKRVSTTTATVLDQVILGAADLKIYFDELWQGTYTAMNYGWDRGQGAAISGMTNPSYANMGALLAANSWDFSPVNSGTEVASTTTPVNAAETCNYQQCGYTTPGASLERTDKGFATGSLDKTNDIAIPEVRANDITVWIRAGSQHEGLPGTLNGENRFCYIGTDVNNKVRTQVPLWRFHHRDAGGWYFMGVHGISGTTTASSATTIVGTGTLFTTELAVGDPIALSSAPSTYAHVVSITDNTQLTTDAALGNGTAQTLSAADGWSGDEFLCEQNIFASVCGASGTNLSVAGPTAGGGCANHKGKQYTEVVKGGVVTLPSGHTFNSLVVRQVADFCIYAVPCVNLFRTEVRTFVYLWQVPHLGSVVLLQSATNVADGSSFTTVDLSNITFGLYPPRTITVTGSTSTSVSLGWDPGLDTHRINRYKVYWGTHSGGSGGYGFNSVSNPGQVSFAGTTATISGLQPGITYYFTVTSLSDFTDPSSGVVTTYESLVYPTQVYGDPASVYPVEVQAATPCTPTSPVQNLLLDKLPPTPPGTGIHFCWNPYTADPGPGCLVGYRVLVAGTPQLRGAFTPLVDSPAGTCVDSAPYPAGDLNFFLVVPLGTGGEGPRGE